MPNDDRLSMPVPTLSDEDLLRMAFEYIDERIEWLLRERREIKRIIDQAPTAYTALSYLDKRIELLRAERADLFQLDAVSKAARKGSPS